MIDIDLDAFQAAAEAATPGTWQFYCDGPSVDPNWHIVTNESRMRVIANVHIEPGNQMDLANATLIAAANPAVILALIDRLRKAEAAREGWKLVPVEPTVDMDIAGMEQSVQGRPSVDDESYVRSIWGAMIAAAPDSTPTDSANDLVRAFNEWTPKGGADSEGAKG